MSNAKPTVINVPAVGQPEWKGEITDGKLDQVINGLLNPNQGFSKALAREVKTLRTVAVQLKEALERRKSGHYIDQLRLEQEDAALAAARKESL